MPDAGRAAQAAPRPEPDGLRARKRVQTRTRIQQAALDLIGQRGYAETSVAQIAEAAVVSESTFFRYFPTKEDVVLWDHFDPQITAEVLALPPEVPPLSALRIAINHVLAGLSADERAELHKRVRLLLEVPALRSVLLDQVDGPLRVLSVAVAQRSGRDPEDPQVRSLVGAVIGVGLSALVTFSEDPDGDITHLVDRGMAHLESGLRL